MEIHVKNEYRVEVGLSGEELQGLGVSFESLDYANIETRRALWTVVGELRRQGVEVRLSGRVLIEAEKAGEGCRLAITMLPQKHADAPSVRQLVKSPSLPAVLSAADAATLRRAALRLGPAAQTETYTHGGRWFLLVKGGCTQAELLLAEEYCPAPLFADSLFCAFLREHGARAEDNGAAAT